MKSSYSINESTQLTKDSFNTTVQEAKEILEKVSTSNLVESCKAYKEEGKIIPILFAQVLQDVCDEEGLITYIHCPDSSLGPINYGTVTVSTDIDSTDSYIGEVFKVIRFTPTHVHVSHFNKHQGRSELEKNYETTFQGSLYEGLLTIMTFMKSSIASIKRYHQSSIT